MKEIEYVQTVKDLVYPSYYSKEVVATDTEFLLRDGSYVFYCLPAKQLNYSDTNNTTIKTYVREKIFALPFLFEKGLFVHAYGPHTEWSSGSKDLKVDKTGLRPVIVQNINFIDPNSGEYFNNRTSWGRLEFGFCGKVVKSLETLAETLRQT